MFKRLIGTGINLVVLAVSIGVFLLAFVLLNVLGAAQRPPIISVLSATRDLSIGQVITPDTLSEKTVFQDDNAAYYILADEAEAVLGGVVAQPIFAGQPVFRTAIVARAAEESRLSAVLGQYPGHSLFPLPLEAMNIVAPEAASFLPGDLVGVTVVIASRPQPPATPAAFPGMVFFAEPTPVPEMASRDVSDDFERAHPPLAKDIFPAGVRVIAVQGLPASASDDSTTFNDFSRQKLLILLIPNKSREVFSLALQQGDKLVVSLMARGQEAPTTGFTYWDFEDLFKADRDEILGGGR